MKQGFFRDHDGKKSSGRLIAFMIVCAGLAVIVAGIIQYIIDPELVSWTAITAAGGSIITLGLGSKMVAKGQEKTELK